MVRVNYLVKSIVLRYPECKESAQAFYEKLCKITDKEFDEIMSSYVQEEPKI